MQVIDGLQAGCNESGLRLLRRYMMHRHLEQTVADIRNSRAGQGVDLQHPSPLVDPRQVSQQPPLLIHHRLVVITK